MSGLLSELDFQRQLVGTKPPGLAVIYGWEHVHFRPAMTKHGYRTAGSGSMAAGWPDLVLVRPRDRRLIFAELKRDGAELSPDQRHVLDLLGALRQTGVEASCGNHKSTAEALAYRCSECPLFVQVVVWHPSDWAAIERVLR